MSRVRADQYTNNAGTGSPLFTHGVRVTGVATATSFDGDLTGNVTGNVTGNADTATTATNAQGLTGTPNLNVGIVTATEFSGDGSNLDNIKSGITTFIASGTISNGNTVVINTDGTVSAVSGSGSVNPSVGISSVFEEALSSNHSVAYDSSNNKIIIAYSDVGNSSHGTAVVGTVTGTGITFGSPTVFEPENTDMISAVYDPTNDKVVIAYRDNGNSAHGTAIVGTVSGDSISFPAAPTVFETDNSAYMSAVHDPINDKIFIAYMDSANLNYGKAIVGTISGDNISFTGAFATTIESVGSSFISAAYDSGNNKIVVSYTDNTNNSGKAVVATVNNNSISYGNPVVFTSNISSNHSVAYDSTNQKIVIAYRDGGNSNYGTAIVGNVSGNTINFGSPIIFNSTDTVSISASYDSNYQRVVISYRDQDDSGAGKAVVGSVSGNTINFGSAFEFNSTSVQHVSSAYDSSNKKVVVAYQDTNNSQYGTANVLSSVNLTTNLTSENYIGIAEEAIADGATGKVNVVGGVNTSQTGLTTAQKYYVNPLGGLSIDPIVPAGESTAGIPIIVAGTSISSTSIIVNGEDDSNSSSGGSGTGGTYGDNSVDAHLNRDGTVGVSSVLSWNGNDYNWQPPGGAWQLISTITANGASTVDFTSGIDNTYRRYVILGSEIQSVTSSNADLHVRVYENGTLYQTGNYHWGNAYYIDFSVGAAYDDVSANSQTNQTYINVSNQNGSLSYPGTLELIIDNPSASKTHYKINSKIENGAASSQRIVWCSASLISASALTNVNGIRLYPSTGTMNGTFKLYGIK